MGKTANRIGTVGFVLAASAAVSLGGAVAASADSGDVVVNSCDRTFKGEDGKSLTVDPTAVVNAPGGLTLGLGSDSSGTGGKSDPTLRLPVSDLLGGLGLTKTPVVRDLTGAVCHGVQATANGVGDTVSSLVGGNNQDPAPPQDPPQDPTPPQNPTPPSNPTPPGDGGGNDPAPPSNPGGGQSTDPVTTVPGAGDSSGSDDSGVAGSFTGMLGTPPSIPAGLAGSFNGPALQAPVLPGIPGTQGPALGTPQQPPIAGQPSAPPDVLAQNSGSAQALPSANAPARLPLLLACLALAVVVAALVRTWMRRKAL